MIESATELVFYLTQFGVGETGNCIAGGSPPLRCLLDLLVGSSGGEGLFALIFAGAMLLGLWIVSDGSVALPGVAVLLFGSVMVPALPGQFQSVAIRIALLGGVAAVLSVARRYVLNPAT